jgi:hypothetical protein
MGPSMNEEELLREVQHIYDKWDMVAKSTGRYFNIFEIAGISDDEVRICRVLHALLSPDGPHGQKTTYLKLFVEDVLKIPMAPEELQSAKVEREYSIDNQRRIDLVIEPKFRTHLA